MKFKKLLLFICIILLCGCNLKNDFKNNIVYTSFYPIEYGVESLYSEYASVKSIYPNGVTKGYEITDKKIKKYSESEIFVYSGLADEASIAKDILNLNKNIKIIDATKGMNINNSLEEIWLDPSNYLMLCSNIKSSLLDYNESNYEIRKTIEDNYDILNEKISELDVALYNLGKNGNHKTLLVTNNVFKYLTKYNINVISIDEKEESLDKNYTEARRQIKNKEIEYVYILDNNELTEAQDKFISDNSLVKININDLFTLSDEETEKQENYISLMKKIIEEFKRELYK